MANAGFSLSAIHWKRTPYPIKFQTIFLKSSQLAFVKKHYFSLRIKKYIYHRGKPPPSCMMVKPRGEERRGKSLEKVTCPRPPAFTPAPPPPPPPRSPPPLPPPASGLCGRVSGLTSQQSSCATATSSALRREKPELPTKQFHLWQVLWYLRRCRWGETPRAWEALGTHKPRLFWFYISEGSEHLQRSLRPTAGVGMRVRVGQNQQMDFQGGSGGEPWSALLPGVGPWPWLFVSSFSENIIWSARAVNKPLEDEIPWYRFSQYWAASTCPKSLEVQRWSRQKKNGLFLTAPPTPGSFQAT